VESPESWQPNSETQAGWYSGGTLISWPGARNVLAAVCEAVTLGEAAAEVAPADAGAVAGADEAGALEAGAPGEPAGVADAGALAGPEAAVGEVADELQAVTSNAAPASVAAALT
jgi:hypothetical protein